jgi:hypothetical protein
MTDARGERISEAGADTSAAVVDAEIAARLSAAAWGPAAGAGGPKEALDLLHRSFRFQGRPDLDRVHPSWWVRALVDESPAVQRLVAANGPPARREALLDALSLDPDDAPPDREPDPEVRAWVLALWAERLVGGEPLRDGEPPAIVALAGLSPQARFRLFQTVGLAKAVLAGLDITGHEGPPRRERSAWLAERLASLDRRARDWALRDLHALISEGSLRGRNLALLGLATAARLLADCDPFRVRWALQHLPYPVAKRVRSLMPAPEKRSGAAARLEALLLKTAWRRLTLEGRISPPHPEDRVKESDVL